MASPPDPVAPAPRRRAGWLTLVLLLGLACGNGSGAGKSSAGEVPGLASGSPPEPTAARRADPQVSREVPAALKPTRASVLAALRERRFGELEKLLSRLADDAAADPAGGEMVADNAFAAFGTALPELEPLLDEWVTAERDSAIPELARARYFAARGWQARGAKWAEDTPDASFVEMRRWFDRAAIDAWSAVRRRERLIDAWSLLVGLAVGRQSECVRVARQGLEQIPASYRIRAQLMNCMRPRWGGSYEAMRTVARDAQSEAGRNPNLRWLLGFEAEDRASMARSGGDLQSAAKWAAQALEEGGEHWPFLLERAVVRSRMGQATEALADIQRALVRSPEETDLLEQEIFLLLRLGREEEARQWLARLEQVDPASTYLARTRSRLARGAAKACEALAKNGAYREAITRCGEALAADPADAESSFWLGRAQVKLGDNVRALAAFESALRANPRHREAVRNLDYLYALRRDWNHIIELWDAYLLLEPGDAKALLERAGTHKHRGDMVAACRDLRSACEMGNAEACQLARGNC